MFQSQATGAAPLCCAQGLDGLQRTLDVVSTADQANAGALVTELSATRWKRVVSPCVSSLDGTPSATPSANITSSSIFTTCIPQTPFTSTETLMSSASPIATSRGLTSLRSSTSTSATSFLPPTSSTVRPPPSPSFTMSNSDTITLAPVSSTPSIIAAGTSQSRSNTTLISSTSSTTFLIPTFISSTSVSPIPSTSVFYPSISAISLSISDDVPTTTSTTSARVQTITISSVETGALSTDTPHDTTFAHQTGAIIGISIGGAFVIFLIILSIFYACKRQRSNRSYNSSMEDMLAVSRSNTSWHPPLEADDDEHYLAGYGRSMSTNYHPKTSGSQRERGLFDDPVSFGGGRSGSTESADAALPAFGGQPPVAQILHDPTHSRGLVSPNHSSNDGNSRPWWDHTEPLNINKRNSSQKPPPTVDSHVSAVGRRSTSSLGFGGSSSSNGHLGAGSSRETYLSRDNRSTSIPEPRPIHKLSGRRHYSTPPTAFVGRDSSFEYGTQRTQEEQDQQNGAHKSISQVILARLHASRRLSASSTVKAYSQCTTIGSEEESATPSREPSYIYSPSLLNPPITISPPQTNNPRGVTRSSYPSRQDDFKGFRWPDLATTLPPAPSPVPTATDTSSMVEGLLHPRLGMALGSSQQASAASLRDDEDYTRPINGLVNNHIRSTTTFDTQNTVDLSDGGT